MNESLLARLKRIALGRALPHSIHRCYRYVKEALKLAGIADVSAVPHTNDKEQGLAKGAMTALPKAGFKNIGKMDPYKTPDGAIVVYKNIKDPTAPGHIALHLMTGAGHMFVSDFKSPRPVSSDTYELIGVFVKA